MFLDIEKKPDYYQASKPGVIDKYGETCNYNFLRQCTREGHVPGKEAIELQIFICTQQNSLQRPRILPFHNKDKGEAIHYLLICNRLIPSGQLIARARLASPMFS